MKVLIKAQNFELILLLLTFYEPTFVTHYMFLLFKYATLLYLLLKYGRNIIYEKRLFASIILYGGVTVISTIVNQLPINTIVASLFYMIQIIDIFAFCWVYVHQNAIDELVKNVAYLFLTICLITDVSMLFLSYEFELSDTSYLIGNKFVVSYLHAFVLALLSMLTKRRKHRFNLGIVAFAILSFFVCVKVTCVTGLVINIAILCLLILPKSIRKFATGARNLVILTVAMNVLIFGSYNLLSNQVVQNFVTTVLHKSVNLTGRLPIYSILISKIKESIFIGYGYFNNVISNIIGYGNAQNGVMKILIDSGLLGLIGYVGIVFFGLNQKGKNSDIFWPFFSFLYGMVIGSTVEINLTHMIVFFAIAVVFANTEREVIYEHRKLSEQSFRCFHDDFKRTGEII